jgi:hypothetical protein
MSDEIKCSLCNAHFPKPQLRTATWDEESCPVCKQVIARSSVSRPVDRVPFAECCPLFGCESVGKFASSLEPDSALGLVRDPTPA